MLDSGLDVRATVGVFVTPPPLTTKRQRAAAAADVVPA